MHWRYLKEKAQVIKGEASDLNPAETMSALWQLQRLSY